ncbi:MAG: protein-disulfide reductase DsbD [Gammaproteobacteria bacterium]|nr:MAG: protein-disulfide reductase DsbD [Gammaproteobacteria bacterium]
MRTLYLLVCSFLFITTSAHAGISGAQDELLEPDKAFALSTRVVDNSRLEASWKIADGYYMYKDKFKFEVTSGGVTLKTPVYPKAKKKKDPLFGEVEVYLHQVAIMLPLERKSTIAEKITLRITAQGCNEPIGVCYPPITKNVDFALPASAAVTTPLASLKSLNQLIESAGGQDQEFLHPDKAFIVDMEKLDNNKVRINYLIAEGYYLYQDKLNFKYNDTAIDKNNIELPKAKIKDDPYFGKTAIYQKSFSAVVTLADNTQGELVVGFQGCADQGICYPPATRTLALAEALPAAAVDSQEDDTNYWLAILGAFGAGLLLTFTPCVLPMIPILSSIIVGQGKEITKLKGGLLAFSYVLGTAATYTFAGALAGATGDQLQSYFQNVWAIGTISAIFFILSLSMFGFYELRVPAFIQSHLHYHSQKMKGGSFIGVFLMGAISALIIGACVSPVLISALSVAIVSQDPMLGGTIMFFMALGMGVILIAIGIGAGSILPKAGVWMDRVKHLFGVLLLAVAIYMLGTIPEVPVLLLWSALLIITSMYLGALQPVPETASGWRYFFKGAGMILFAWGIFAMIGGFSGNRSIMHPIALQSMGTGIMVSTGASAGPAAQQGHLFDRVTTVAEIEDRIAKAMAENKGVILDFFASWCTDCVRMEETTFSHAKVKQTMKDYFVLLQVDVTDPNNADGKAIKRRFSVFGPPALLFFDKNGKERKDLHFYGYRNAKDFLKVLDQARQ